MVFYWEFNNNNNDDNNNINNNNHIFNLIETLGVYQELWKTIYQGWRKKHKLPKFKKERIKREILPNMGKRDMTDEDWIELKLWKTKSYIS